MYLYIEVYAIREVSMASAAILLIMIVSIQKAQNLAGLKAGIRRPYVFSMNITDVITMQCPEGSMLSKLGNRFLFHFLFTWETSSAWVPSLCSVSPKRLHTMLTHSIELSSMQKPQGSLSCLLLVQCPH